MVYSGDARYPRDDGVEAIGLGELASILAAAWMTASDFGIATEGG